jgi:hypothetical protein
MQKQEEIEQSLFKAFHALMVYWLGEEVWARRREAYLEKIRAHEASIDWSKPIEPQLFEPKENDIDWYILASELAWDYPHSDANYSTRRLYPYIMAIGRYAEQLRAVPNVQGVASKMLGNKSSPENQIFELLTAAFYLKNGFDVQFIPENSIAWPDGSKKSPDLLVKKQFEMYVECKRAAKQTQYSQSEESAWRKIWECLSTHMLATTSWRIADITFHSELETVEPDEVIQAYDSAVRNNLRVDLPALSISVRTMDSQSIHRHYDDYSVRPNCPQQELLIFGNVDYNEKRSVATVAQRAIKPGEEEDVLNFFIDRITCCVAAQWRCGHTNSMEKRSRHFKGLVHDAMSQIPPIKPGVIHIWYETREGIDVEFLRRKKHLENLSGFDASRTSVLGVFIHGVNYYPTETNYQWAETVQDFARVPDLDRMFKAKLMLSADNTPSANGETHWAQDLASKQQR